MMRQKLADYYAATSAADQLRGDFVASRDAAVAAELNGDPDADQLKEKWHQIAFDMAIAAGAEYDAMRKAFPGKFYSRYRQYRRRYNLRLRRGRGRRGRRRANRGGKIS